MHFVPHELPEPVVPLPFVSLLPDGWDDWLKAGEVPVGTPFLMSPRLEYDVQLNEFFRSPGMMGAAWNTQAGYARDVSAFLTFLWASREKSWRDATERDHLAYGYWRRRDPAGPLIDAATWDREVAAQNRFFAWQVKAGVLPVNPVPQRERRAMPIEAGHRGRGAEAGQTPATYSHSRSMGRVEWLPVESYRRWRDIGMRGYTPDGLPDSRFRGRWATRNASFCDLMVRTGLRLSEQASLTMLEVPLDRGRVGYRRFWLPPAIAKGGSSRWVYVPGSVCAELLAYAEFDRAEVVDRARADGVYGRIRQPLVIEDPARPVAIQRHRGTVRRVKVSQLAWPQRRRLLMEGSAGLEPAAFWLSEFGTPIAVSTWKGLFAEANARCRAGGVSLHAFAHLLRHTFAVITLEQLQRGHIAELAELTPAQRGHYTKVFGDPLDWVRRRLGHRSAVTTQVYLHALAELEMETRMALVPDEWEDPRPLMSAAGDTSNAPEKAGS